MALSWVRGRFRLATGWKEEAEYFMAELSRTCPAEAVEAHQAELQQSERVEGELGARGHTVHPSGQVDSVSELVVSHAATW